MRGKRPQHEEGRPSRARRWSLAYCGAILLILAGFAAATVLPLRGAKPRLTCESERSAAAGARTADLSDTLSAFQLLIEQNLTASGDTLSVLSARAAEMSQSITTDVQGLVKAAPGTPIAPYAAELHRAGAAFTKGITELAIQPIGPAAPGRAGELHPAPEAHHRFHDGTAGSNNPTQRTGIHRVHVAQIVGLVLWSLTGIGVMSSALDRRPADGRQGTRRATEPAAPDICHHAVRSLGHVQGRVRRVRRGGQGVGPIACPPSASRCCLRTRAERISIEPSTPPGPTIGPAVTS